MAWHHCDIISKVALPHSVKKKRRALIAQKGGVKDTMANLETLLKKTEARIEKLNQEKASAEEKKKEMMKLADEEIAKLGAEITDLTKVKTKAEKMLKEQEEFQEMYDALGGTSKKKASKATAKPVEVEEADTEESSLF